MARQLEEIFPPPPPVKHPAPPLNINLPLTCYGSYAMPVVETCAGEGTALVQAVAHGILRICIRDISPHHILLSPCMEVLVCTVD